MMINAQCHTDSFVRGYIDLQTAGVLTIFKETL